MRRSRPPVRKKNERKLRKLVDRLLQDPPKSMMAAGTLVSGIAALIIALRQSL